MSIFFEIEKVQSGANGKDDLLNFDLGHGLVSKCFGEQIVERFILDDNLVEALAKYIRPILLSGEFLNCTNVREFEFRSLFYNHFQ